jgi:putative phosphoribosyl transferase
MSFKDRADAGRKLALALGDYKNQQPVILALPRGGVPVAAKVAAALNAPLDLILVRKIGVPYQPELAMGAVVDGDEPLVVRNEDVIRFAGIDDSEFNAVCDSELAEIERRRQRYLGSRERVEVAGRTAIVIDDGIATGATTRAALRATRMRKPKKLILALLQCGRRQMKLYVWRLIQTSDQSGFTIPILGRSRITKSLGCSRDFPRENSSSHPSPQPEGGGQEFRSCCLPLVSTVAHSHAGKLRK